MADPLGDLTVRISVVGHASPRWRGAASQAEAESLNRALSGSRAAAIYPVVEQILKSELPGYKIQVGELGVGSTERFPSVGEGDNAAIDRTVVVTVELVTSQKLPQPPQLKTRQVWWPSKVWTVRVLNLHKLGAGVLSVFVRVSIENPFLKDRKLIMAGYLYGGGSPAKSIKDIVKKNIKRSAPKDAIAPVGHGVMFDTYEAMDFDNWKHGGTQSDGNGVLTRIGSFELKFGLATKLSYIKFPLLEEDLLVFDSKTLGLGTIGGDGTIVAGTIYPEGPVPSSYKEEAAIPDTTETNVNRTKTDVLPLFFPTGKSGYGDLTERDRKALRDFVTNKARSIKDFSSNFTVRGG